MVDIGRGRMVRGQWLARSATLQYLGGVLFAVLLPWIARVAVEPEQANLASQYNAGIGTLAALTFGQMFLRSLTNFPGIRGANYVIPTFAISYGTALVVFLFLRLDYGRLQFIFSFFLCIVWYVAVLRWRYQRVTLKIGIVPGGESHGLQNIDSVAWTTLSVPNVGRERFDGIVADLRADLPDEWDRFLTESALSGIPVYHVKQIRESLTGRVEIEHLSENNFGSLIPGLAYVTIKFVTDFIAALIAAVVLAPVMLIAALLIKLDSKGPVLFRQQRMGYRGQPFTVIKFRTMTDFRHGTPSGDESRRSESGVEGDIHSAITQVGDDRITRVGRLLRRTRIDELPQIYNILRGEMSWIGPRPEALVLSRWYERELPFYRYRHIVRPGISGWAQVNQGHVAEVDEVLWKLHFDFYYIKYFTPWLDLLIVFRTLNTVFTGFGAR